MEERLFRHLVRKEKAYWGPFRGGARGAEEVHRALSSTIDDSIVTRRGRPLHIEGGSRGYCIDEGGGVGHGVAPNDNFANGVALALRVRWPARQPIAYAVYDAGRLSLPRPCKTAVPLLS